MLACDIPEAKLPSFVRVLAEGQGGLSLVFMHHADSLKSKTSYQNDARIRLKDHLEVRVALSLHQCLLLEIHLFTWDSNFE